MMAHNQEVWTWSQWQQQQQQHCDNPTLEAMNPCPPLQNLYPKPKTSICLNMRIFFFLENPLPTNHYWAKILGGELKSYNCRSQSQKSFNPDWWRPKSSLLISINTHARTHARTHRFSQISTTLMKLKNQFQKISLLISINTEEFRKFLQPMMKLNKSGCSYKSTEFHTSYYKHSEAQKTSVCSSAESTQICFCKTGNRIVDTEEEEQQQQQWVTISIIFPFLSFFLSQCFWWNPIPQGNE